jgi:uncharacterized protein DUF1566
MRPVSRLLILTFVLLFVARLALHGQQPPGGRFVDGGRFVRDTQTNLIWEKKDTSGGLHDVNKTVTWCDATGNTEGLCAGSTSWIAQVNAEKFAGFSDWRVPTGKELLTLVDKTAAGCGSGSPCISSMIGPTKAFRYWASDEPRRTSRGTVDFYLGGPQNDFQKNEFHVRAVRTAQ